jgi:CHAT domain-containing protein
MNFQIMASFLAQLHGSTFSVRVLFAITLMTVACSASTAAVARESRLQLTSPNMEHYNDVPRLTEATGNADEDADERLCDSVAATDMGDQAELASGIILNCQLVGANLYDLDPSFRRDVHGILAPQLGKTLPDEHLKGIQDAITQLYLKRGYLTSWVNDINILADGTLAISVTEGFIQNVRIILRHQEGKLYVPIGNAAEQALLLDFFESITPSENSQTNIDKRLDRAGFAQGERIFEYLKPVLRDEQNQPQQPINLEALDEQLDVLENLQEFAGGEVFYRLRPPRQSGYDRTFLERQSESLVNQYQAYLEARRDELDPASADYALIQQQLQALSTGTLLVPFDVDTVAPGASVLEIEFRVPDGNSPAGTTLVEGDDLAEFSFQTLFSRIEQALDFEDHFGDEFESIIGADFTETLVAQEFTRLVLHSLELQEPDIRAAVVYVVADGDRVSIRVETAYEQPILIENITRYEAEELPEDIEEDTLEEIPEERIANLELQPGDTVNRDELVREVEEFWREIQNPSSDAYRESADRLYDLLVRPIEYQIDLLNEAESQPEQKIKINTLLFAIEQELGLLPIAALYDSEAELFLAEKYRVGIIPSFPKLNFLPSELDQADLLVMGTSEFRDPELFKPLTAVPLELSLLETIWDHRQGGQTTVYRNEEFTLDALRQQRQQHPYQIVHLATHANFRPGRPGDSSIQLWDTALPLNDLQVATLNWSDPPVELLVLSACQTALGSSGAELGFAGLSLQSGVKSVLASLWYVNDLATLVYMMEFYRALREGVTKVEAVQTAQRAMLDEQRVAQTLKELYLVTISLLTDGRYLEVLTEAERSRLETLSNVLDQNNKRAEVAEQFLHPYYWSSYTLVGSPW